MISTWRAPEKQIDLFTTYWLIYFVFFGPLFPFPKQPLYIDPKYVWRFYKTTILKQNISLISFQGVKQHDILA